MILKDEVEIRATCAFCSRVIWAREREVNHGQVFCGEDCEWLAKEHEGMDPHEE